MDLAMQTKKEFVAFFDYEILKGMSIQGAENIAREWNEALGRSYQKGYIPKSAILWKLPAHYARKPKLKKGDNIVVIGKRWFDRINGNTYHSVAIIVNGESVAYLPFQYGYDDQYRQTAQKWLTKNYSMPKKYDTEHDPLWRIREHGIVVNFSVSDVSRKKDL
jgi:hypothetical protein